MPRSSLETRRVLKRKPPTFAAKWNSKLLHGIQAMLTADPEADIAALLPKNYSEKLQSHKRGNRSLLIKGSLF